MNFYHTLTELWLKTKKKATLGWQEKVLFAALCFCEFLYRGAFLIVLFCKRLWPAKKIFCPVISIGNISLGGTGKSVLVRCIIENLPSFHGAIITRGYKGKNETRSQSVLVNAQNINSLNPALVGDEPYMLAALCGVPVVVGKNRRASAELLLSFASNIDYVLLDDGYQNDALYKNVEILLLDARAPWENEHVLPAGPLREKDISRADIIIISHADQVDAPARSKLKAQISNLTPKALIFEGKHTVVGLCDNFSRQLSSPQLHNKSFLACGALGSFSGFVASLESCSLQIGATLQFQDHHAYTAADIAVMARLIKDKHLDGMITTRKDWYKIIPLLNKLSSHDALYVICVDVTFNFLTPKQHATFFSYLENSIRSY